MCNHDCTNCETKCSLANISPELNTIIKQNKEQKEMGNLGGCHSDDKEKIGRLDEQNGAIRIAVGICGGMVVVSAALIIGFALAIQSQIAEARIDIREQRTRLELIKDEMNELKATALDARRGYDNARKTLQRIREESK